MTNKKVKNFWIMPGNPEDIYDDYVDVFVTLEGDDFGYSIEFATPLAFLTQMEKDKKKFVEPDCPPIIVSELTPEVIREALEAYATDIEDSYWIKVYQAPLYQTIDDLNTILDREKKRDKEEKEEKEKEDNQ